MFPPPPLLISPVKNERLFSPPEITLRFCRVGGALCNALGTKHTIRLSKHNAHVCRLRDENITLLCKISRPSQANQGAPDTKNSPKWCLVIGASFDPCSLTPTRASFFHSLSGMKTLFALGIVLLALAAAHADDDPAELRAGHSAHGEAFNEGPRQAAYLMDGMPDISFPVTTSSPEAQKFFNQGIGQLHGFWFFEAERSFRQVLAMDTNCAMAVWGMAMANTSNERRAKGFIEKAVKMTNDLSRRECLYIESLSKFHSNKSDDRHRQYIRGLEQIIEEFPDDIEAKAFLVFEIWDNNGRQKITSYMAADALAQQVLAVKPMHPVHHALIHLWNYEADRRALAAAAHCGQGSPGIAHMWHMPGHTYSALHRYADAAWQQEASARVDHAYMIHNRVMPDQIHNYAH